ncbi:CvpA family protein [Xylocopilactobacillus apis]|uniref:Colicin V production protein n=1 Tax=Xylocopilactobacillus apis TaxID=2932183 RepID=A0AAU9DET7_9LACO|nr:CvpA family protein [Xylocopilactobacillus apis]BDR56716.1 hypothetical protein KIMC2_12780 [Xylocopilactobacillus apis]
MYSLLTIGWIIYSVYFSMKRGFKLEAMVFGGYLLSGLLAAFLYPMLWRMLSLYIPYSSVTNEKPFYFYPDINVFKIENSFYKIVTFMIFYFILCLIIRFIEVFIKDVQFAESSESLKIVTGIMGFITAIFGAYLIFSALSMIPLSGLQNSLKHSISVNILVKGPLSWLFNQLWF